MIIKFFVLWLSGEKRLKRPFDKVEIAHAITKHTSQHCRFEINKIIKKILYNLISQNHYNNVSEMKCKIRIQQFFSDY